MTWRRQLDSTRHTRVGYILWPQETIAGFALETIADDAQWQEVIFLLTQDKPQAIHLWFGELAVTRGSSLGGD